MKVLDDTICLPTHLGEENKCAWTVTYMHLTQLVPCRSCSFHCLFRTENCRLVSLRFSPSMFPGRTSDTTVPSVRVSFLETTLYPNQRGTTRHSAHHTTPRNMIAIPTTQYLEQMLINTSASELSSYAQIVWQRRRVSYTARRANEGRNEHYDRHRKSRISRPCDMNAYRILQPRDRRPRAATILSHDRRALSNSPERSAQLRTFEGAVCVGFLIPQPEEALCTKVSAVAK